MGKVSAFEGMRAVKSGALGLEGTAGLQLLDTKGGSIRSKHSIVV